jgi:NAD(P)-dependent dehydrogenase (short-subunit alcohol dehydrogenase family)
MSKSRRVFITGASRGLGKETALRLGRRGAHVFVTGLASEEKALKEVARAAGNPHAWAIADVRSMEQMEAAMKRAHECMGRIDIVINNAGIARQMTIEDPKFIEELEVTLAVNLIGTVNTTKAALPYLTKGGYVFCMSSAAAYVSAPLIGAYNASKAAVRAFAETLRVELEPRGIKVGYGVFTELKTDMTKIGFGTNAGEYVLSLKGHRVLPVAEVQPAIKAIVRCVEHKRRHADSPRRVRFIRLFPWLVQPVIERFVRPRMAKALQLARSEVGPRTTELPPTG